MTGAALPRHPASFGPQLAALPVAAAAWAGLGLEFARLDASRHAAAPTLWAMLRYFTITTNLAVAIAFTALACGLRPGAMPRWLAGLSLSTLLVGVVFRLLLEGLFIHGLGLATVLMHRVTPVAVPLYWLAFVPKGRLGLVDPPLWLLYPLAYLAYALTRGSVEGRYPYPFLDVAAIGPARVGINALAIGVGFLGTGFVSVWIDRMLGRRNREPSA
ncbi:Pr6Pr family membrane protein [Lichenihabitans sp. Uapishka_5]|uniref:Pr6Pr family membrane protein n=1 Tax=Lichenihabitans sp. Uapishka_5 TaxID=3037302 RepID=UPI0029E7FF7B|nr:Pr6Pr family membrane protein [Lichenihabitans sp. Uapishka_5]MDX7953802.1 Pr6Pr family membrane protein [Lichenihabitans sp. Uapishka_5]